MEDFMIALGSAIFGLVIGIMANSSFIEKDCLAMHQFRFFEKVFTCEENK